MFSDRLDQISRRKRAATVARFRRDHPALGEAEIARLADLLAACRMQVIAEAALHRLSEDDRERVLSQFELAVGDREE